MLSSSQIQQIQATVPILRQHGEALTGYFYNRMLTQHPELRETFNLGHQRSGNQAKALAGAVLAYAEHIEAPAVLQGALSMIVQKHVSLNIRPDQYSIVGENLLASMSEVLNTPLDSELIQAWAIAYQQLADILIGQEKTVYTQHQQQAGGWTGWREFRIANRQAESSEISSFYLEPVDGQALPHYEVGQYLSLRVHVPELGMKQPRQYSLSDLPHADHYRISVKHEQAPLDSSRIDGWVSSTLHRHVQLGDIVELSMPNGDFYLRDPKRPVVLLSAGVGITPMIAMLNQLASRAMPQPVQFIHACRNAEVHAFHTHLSTLAAQYPQLQYWVAYEQPTEQSQLGQDYQHAGRIGRHQLQALALHPDADYYLCGPTAFIQAQRLYLSELGIASEQIFSEVFGTGGIS